jgi:hypothetical protein
METLIQAQSLIAWGLTTLAGAFAGSYLAGYLSKKGENLATHEDINKLVDQVRAVTTATKEIEAKISNEVWDRQKRWELKRDVLFEIIKRTGKVSDTLTHIEAIYQTQGWPSSGTVKPEAKEALLEAITAFSASANEFDSARMLAGLVCGKELEEAAHQFNLVARNIVTALTHGDAAAQTKRTEFVPRMCAVTVAVRKELEVDKQIELPRAGIK